MIMANGKTGFYPTLSQQISLKKGKNIWLNLKGGNSVVVIAGKNCYVARDVIFGRKVILGDGVDIKAHSVVGITTDIVGGHDGKPTKAVVNNLVKTVIEKGVIIYMGSTVSGKITGRCVDANTVIKDGKTVYENKPSGRNGTIHHKMNKRIMIGDDPHYPSDNNI